MSALILWAYCEKCGRRIPVGEICYNIGEDSYCRDCCKEVDTQEVYESWWSE